MIDIGCVSTVPESTCENEDGEYQKCIRFTPDKRYIVTGGSDGSCKVFKVSCVICVCVRVHVCV